MLTTNWAKDHFAKTGIWPVSMGHNGRNYTFHFEPFDGKTCDGTLPVTGQAITFEGKCGAEKAFCALAGCALDSFDFFWPTC